MTFDCSTHINFAINRISIPENIYTINVFEVGSGLPTSQVKLSLVVVRMHTCSREISASQICEVFCFLQHAVF